MQPKPNLMGCVGCGKSVCLPINEIITSAEWPSRFPELAITFFYRKLFSLKHNISQQRNCKTIFRESGLANMCQNFKIGCFINLMENFFQSRAQLSKNTLKKYELGNKKS